VFVFSALVGDLIFMVRVMILDSVSYFVCMRAAVLFMTGFREDQVVMNGRHWDGLLIFGWLR
jgi:hypothetical protein